MTAHRETLVFVGLPATGKSTYLAALWHVIDSDRDSLGCSLGLEELDDECVHVNSLSDTWRKCEAVVRTSKENEQTVRMLVRER